MLKTIKTTKQLRLDELIKYVRENKKTLFKGNVTISFKTKNNNEVIFYEHGELTLDNWISSVDLFEVEVEEEITKDTEFEYLLAIYITKDLDKRPIAFEHKTINEILRTVGQYYQIYAMIDGKLEIIWERR